MSRFIYIACLLALYCSFSLAGVPFPRRSPDILIEHRSIDDDSVLYLHGAAFAQTSKSSIEDKDVAALISHVTGTPLFSSSSLHDGFPKISLFLRPKANLFFAVHGVGASDIQQAPLASSVAVPLTSSIYPPSPAASMRAMMTGTSYHGRSWTEHGEGSISLPQILSTAAQGRSLVLSASGCRMLSHSLSAHRSEDEATSAHTYSYALVGEEGAQSFATVRGSSADALHLGIPHEAVAAQAFLSFINAVAVGDKLIVKNEQATVEYDLAEDFSFVSELAFAFNLAQQFEAAPADSLLHYLIIDDAPDFISIAFSGLKSLARKYTKADSRFVVGVSLVNAVIAKTTSAVSAAYKDRVAVEAVFLNGQIRDVEAKRVAALSVVEGALEAPEKFAWHYPRIFLAAETSIQDREAICTSLRAAVDSGSQVHCADPYEALYVSVGAVLANATNGTCNGTKTYVQDNDKIAAEHLLTWVPIILLLLVLSGIYGVVAIGRDMTKDTLLFRTAGRHLHQS